MFEAISAVIPVIPVIADIYIDHVFFVQNMQGTLIGTLLHFQYIELSIEVNKFT